MPKSPSLTVFSLLVFLGAAGCVQGRSLQENDTKASSSWLTSLSQDALRPQPKREQGPLLAALSSGPMGAVHGGPTLSVSDALGQAAARTTKGHKHVSACPRGMVPVSGEYCPKVKQTCVRWMETTGKFAYFRCAEYAKPARCLAPRRSMRYCIDRDEYAPKQGNLPLSNQSWTSAKQICERQGKRLCRESEWIFACEGEEMRPYPYGFTRDAAACNADRLDIYQKNGSLRDLREGPNGHPSCVSPFGVHHLTGNLEEWTTIDGTSPPRPAMKGAYWQPSHNTCRDAQTAHDQFYHGTETGFRCCKDLN